MPSWVPDWRQKLSYVPVEVETYTNDGNRLQSMNFERQQNHDGSSPFIFRHKGVDGLVFQTKVFDRIRKVIPIPRGAKDPVEILSAMVEQYVQECPQFGSGTTDAHLRAIIDTLNMEVMGGSTDTSIILSPEYAVAIDKAIQGRALFVTAGNNLGIGPANTLPGDEAWMTSPGCLPIVLRRFTSPVFPHPEAPTVKHEIVTAEAEPYGIGCLPTGEPTIPLVTYPYDVKVWQELGVSWPPRTYRVIGEFFVRAREDYLWSKPWRECRVCLI